MRCSKVRDSLMDYLSDEISADRAERVREHLAGCDLCRAHLEPARRALDALSMLAADDPTPSLLGGVKARLADEEIARRSQPRLRPALAFAMVFFGVLTGAWLWHMTARQAWLSEERQVRVNDESEHRRVPPASGRPQGIGRTPVRIAQARDRRHHERRWRSAAATDRRAFRQARVVPTNENVPFGHPPIRTPAVEPEPVMMFVLQPREPEYYLVQVADQGAKPTDLAVKREFDIAGNITSVTIDMGNADTQPDGGVSPGASNPAERTSATNLQARHFNLLGGDNHV